MEIRKCLVLSGLVIVLIVHESWANPVHNSGRVAKVLEAPLAIQNVPFSSGGDKTSLEAPRSSLSIERNMMLYRTVFTLSLKLLTVFFLARLFGQVVSGSGAIHPLAYSYPQQVHQPTAYTSGYAYDVNHNPASNIAQQPASAVVATSVGTTGGSGAVLTAAAPVLSGGYLAAATNSRPSFLLPRFRFGLRHPPRGMMAHLPPNHYNMGGETQMVETHSHLYVLPDGSQARVPMTMGQARPAPVSVTNSVATTSAETDVKAGSSTQRPSTDSVSIANDSTSVAQRRLALATAFKEKQYTDWLLHYNPGTRSL